MGILPPRLCQFPEGAEWLYRVRFQSPTTTVAMLALRRCLPDTGLGVGLLVAKPRQRPKLWPSRLLDVGVCLAAPPPTRLAKRGGLRSATAEIE